MLATHRLYRYVSLGAYQIFIECLYLVRRALAYLNLRSPKHQTNDQMSEQLNVLCCFNCSMYQVHTVKKSNKWQCKMCGKNQTIQIVYFQGSGSDCRKQVQHLKYLKAKKEGSKSFHPVTIDKYGLDCIVNESDKIECNCPSRVKHSVGKWSKSYLGTNVEDDSDGESSDKKENRSVSQDDIHRCGKWVEKRNQFYSLSPNQDPSKISCQSGEWDKNEPKARTSRSRTFPLVENPSRIPHKWDKYLSRDVTEASSSNAKVSKNEIPDKVSVLSNNPSKNNVFDDLNDHLDVNMDF